MSVSEVFGAIKEIKVAELEQTYVKNFANSAKIYAKTQAYSNIINNLPKYIIEGIAFGGILLIILYIMAVTGSFQSALPIISLYVFAGYRLMPALQQIYSSINSIAFIGPSIDKLYDEFVSIKPLDKIQENNILKFEKEISLKNIYYKYPNTSRMALENLNFSISAKSTIALVGATGSGKTTTVDLILGLIDPEKGNLEVDGKVITTKNSRSWRRFIGYVPQNIYLSDDTVAANIAFGADPKHIDYERVEKASIIANLHNFVINQLPQKYQTTIGERGVRLSGGERQRIGIARALYHKPKVLILDEATSALDNQTEKSVMNAINNLDKNLTIIIIAHRLNTVKNCDKIFLLENGKLINHGAFSEIIKDNEDFKKSVTN